MKKILIAFSVLLFFSCSSDDAVAVRKVTFKADGIYKVFEDIKVSSHTDNSWEVPFTRLEITAVPKDGTPETFSIVINRGGDYDGQSINGGAYVNGNVYNYDFEHPIQTDISVNTTKRIKGTFEGVYINEQGENVQITEGKIDITYYPDNPYYIKK